MIVTDLKGEIFHRPQGIGRQKEARFFCSRRGVEDPPLQSSRLCPADRGNRTRTSRTWRHPRPGNTESENSIWQATAQQVMAGAISYINESVYYAGESRRS